MAPTHPHQTEITVYIAKFDLKIPEVFCPNQPDANKIKAISEANYVIEIDQMQPFNMREADVEFELEHESLIVLYKFKYQTEFKTLNMRR